MFTMAGLQRIESKDSTQEKKQLTVCRGVANIVSLVIFYILVRFLLKGPVYVPKGVVIAPCLKFPTLVKQHRQKNIDQRATKAAFMHLVA